ncbi:MAG: hypothetical protein R3E96_02420 [Planctomycetota bacterium]
MFPSALPWLILDLTRWWQEVVASESKDGISPKNLLPEAFAAARDHGKPLLVFLISIPKGRFDFPSEGRALGDLLGFGDDRLWTALALCDVELVPTEDAAAWFAASQGESTGTSGENRNSAGHLGIALRNHAGGEHWSRQAPRRPDPMWSPFASKIGGTERSTKWPGASRP